MAGEKRLCLVPISFDLLSDMVKQGFKAGPEVGFCECVEGIPNDAVLVRSFTDAGAECGFLVFEHESFAPVPEGSQIPEARISFVRHMSPTPA